MSDLQPIEVRVAVIETQIKRMASDQESEKGTRARANTAISDEIRALADEHRRDQRRTDRFIWMAFGGMAVLNSLVAIYLKLPR